MCHKRGPFFSSCHVRKFRVRDIGQNIFLQIPQTADPSAKTGTSRSSPSHYEGSCRVFVTTADRLGAEYFCPRSLFESEQYLPTNTRRIAP